jgi:outer membrane receptor protein involved in Fe transport
MAQGPADPPNFPGSDEVLTLEPVIVTGSRIYRSGFTTMQPVTVIESEFLEDRGASNLADIINELPAFGLPGNSTQGTQGLTGIGAEFVNFFGLGSQRTLVLVNGRRFVSGNSPTLFSNAEPGLQVDFNMIPVAMVDRIEIIAVGGAPIYGSDAIAGTVNVIMKNNFEGLEVTASHGWADEGNSLQEDRFTVVTGGNFASNRGNIVAGFEHTRREGLRQSERSHLAAGWDFRQPLGESPYEWVLIRNSRPNIVSRNGVISPFPLLIPNLGIGAVGQSPDGQPLYLQFSPDGSLESFDPGQPTGNLIYATGGDALFLPEVTALFTPVNRSLFNVLGRFELTDRVEAFGEFFYANSKTEEIANQPAYQTGFFAGESFALSFSADHPLLTDKARQTLADLGMSRFWLHRASVDLRDNGRGGNPAEQEAHMWRGVGGLRGNFVALNRYFDWDISYNVGEYDAYTREVDIDSRRFFYALDVVLDENGQPACRVTVDPSSRPPDANEPFGGSLGTTDYDDCVPLDIFGENRASEEALTYIQRNLTTRTSINQSILTANITFGLFELPAGELGFAAGFEHREEKAQFNPGGWAQTGFGRRGPIVPLGGGYKTDELYAEFYLPLAHSASGIPLVDSASIEGAYRTVKNTRSGRDGIWTIGGRYAPVADVEFRGNFMHSARAPAVTELFLPQTEIQSFANDPCDFRHVDQGPNPSTRRANCIADGIDDPDSFVSAVNNRVVNGVRGGNPDLRNEVADSWTAGVILRPGSIPGLQIAVDYVDIDLRDAIGPFSLTDTMESCYDQSSFPNEFCERFVRLPDGQLPLEHAFEIGYVNAGRRVLRAFTAEADYSFELFSGSMRATLYMFLPKESVIRTREAVDDSLGEPDMAEVQAQLNLRYRRGDWSALLQTRYIGSAAASFGGWPPNPDVSRIPAAWFFNTMLSWNVTQSIRIRANVNNIFDERPAPQAIAVGWDNVYDNIGRYYRLSLEASF